MKLYAIKFGARTDAPDAPTGSDVARAIEKLLVEMGLQCEVSRVEVHQNEPQA